MEGLRSAVLKLDGAVLGAANQTSMAPTAHPPTIAASAHVVECHSLTVPSSEPVRMSGSSGWKHTVAMLCAWPSRVCWLRGDGVGSRVRRAERQAMKQPGAEAHGGDVRRMAAQGALKVKRRQAGLVNGGDERHHHGSPVALKANGENGRQAD